MSNKEWKDVVIKFNTQINERNITGLDDLMAEDHIFIDTLGNKVIGKQKCLKAWRKFFEWFPDYKNIFEKLTLMEDKVLIQGYSVCSDTRLDGTALWTAKIRDGRISEWRVYNDTPENRNLLDLKNTI